MENLLDKAFQKLVSEENTFMTLFGSCKIESMEKRRIYIAGMEDMICALFGLTLSIVWDEDEPRIQYHKYYKDGKIVMKIELNFKIRTVQVYSPDIK